MQEDGHIKDLEVWLYRSHLSFLRLVVQSRYI